MPAKIEVGADTTRKNDVFYLDEIRLPGLLASVAQSG
jgi:hypothetical protein